MLTYALQTFWAMGAAHNSQKKITCPKILGYGVGRKQDSCSGAGGECCPAESATPPVGLKRLAPI